MFMGGLSPSRSSHQRCSVKKGVIRYFAKFTGKHSCQSLFLIKLQTLPATLLKKETLVQVFSYEFCEISKNTFFTEHLWATASVQCFKNNLILPTLIPQSAIFGILESASNDSIFKSNKVFINHIVLIFKLYVYKSREENL